MSALICAGVSSGCACRSSAATPATSGVAIEVPEMEMCRLSRHLEVLRHEPHSVAQIFTPGALTSGLSSVCATPFTVHTVGPREEKDAIAVGQLGSTPTSAGLHAAATVAAVRAVPGDSMVCAPGPLFPAATAKSTPTAVALSRARDTASSGFP